MKKISAILILFFFVSKLNAQTQWTATNRNNFMKSCIPAAKAGMSEDSAKYYCYCMLGKIEVMYPNPADADKVTQAELQTSEWKNMIRACLGGYWTNAQRNEFMSSCINEAKVNIPEAKAKPYCECMMYKIEFRYHNYADTDKLTAEQLSTPEWMKIIKGCLEQ